MAIREDLEQRLDEVCTQLGIPGMFAVNGDGINPGTLKVSVGSWPYDYSVDPAKLLDQLDAKKLILLALRHSAP